MKGRAWAVAVRSDTGLARDGAILVLAAVLIAVSPALSTYWAGLLTQALIFATFAAGLDLLVGFAGLPSLGHGAFFGIGGYGAAMAVTKWDMDPWTGATIGVAAGIAIAAALAPLVVRVKALAFLTVTLAFGQVCWGLATRGGETTGGENGLPGVARPRWFWDIDGAHGYLAFTLLWSALLAVLIVRVAASPVGLSWIGVRESETRMTALGYDPRLRRTAAFVAAAAVGAVCGVLSGFYNEFVGPGSLEWRQSAQILLAVVVGGAGSLWGPFIAGGGLFVLETYVAGETARWPMILGLLYVASVVLLPGGLASLPATARRRLHAPRRGFARTAREQRP